MPRWFEGRPATCIVVTRGTVTRATAVVGPRAANKGCSGMAKVAIQCGSNVGGVSLGIFANRDTTIMTRGAIIDDTGMIKNRTGEATRGMTGATILNGCNMVDYFASGEYPIMTGNTVIDDTDMRKRRG